MRHALLALALVLGAGCSKQKEEPPAQAPAPAPTPAAPTATPTPTPTPAPAKPPEIAPLRVGVTLHPYYSWTANVIAGVPGAEVVPVLPGDVDAGSYQPSPADIAKLSGLDALVVNGIGHDDFITGMIKSSGNTKLVRIDANQGTPLLDSGHSHGPSKGQGHAHKHAHKNSHTFISFTNAIQQTKQIATKLGELRPPGADRFRDNAAAYADRLRKLQTDAAGKLAGAKQRRVVTVHDGYAYLLQELGIEVAGVVEPAHGLVPSAKELANMIALMKKEQVAIVFTEESFPDKLLATLRDATGARVYVLSHVAVGAYTPEKFETEMAKNAETLVQALVTDAK